MVVVGERNVELHRDRADNSAGLRRFSAGALSAKLHDRWAAQFFEVDRYGPGEHAHIGHCLVIPGDAEEESPVIRQDWEPALVEERLSPDKVYEQQETWRD